MEKALALTLACFLAFAPLAGCSMLYDPCGDLETRLCADLGGDCSVFQSNPTVHDAIVPQRRRQAEKSQCEMYAAPENYQSYTLPWTRYLVAQTRDPSTPAPQLPPPVAVDGLASGVSGYWLYLLPVLIIPLIFLYSVRSMRAAKKAAQGGGQPPPAGQGPPDA